MTQTILVTGGGGFLGSHLCESLLAKGFYVIALDNFYSSSPENVLSLKSEPRFELIRHDVCFPFYFECDYIVNLACPASPVHYQRDPVQTLKTNVSGSINALGMAKRLKIPILQASTSEIYGDPKEHPQKESYWGNVNPVGPRSCYDEGKRCAETLFMDYHRQHSLKTKIIRIFNTYGPHMSISDGRVVSNFICQALSGRPLTIYGDGSQTRSFCYVKDLVEGIQKVLFSGDAGCIYNLGNTSEVSVGYLAQMIINLTESSSEIVYKSLPTDDPLIRRPDTLNVETDLGWRASTSLEEGLLPTIDYFRKVLK